MGHENRRFSCATARISAGATVPAEACAHVRTLFARRPPRFNLYARAKWRKKFISHMIICFLLEREREGDRVLGSKIPRVMNRGSSRFSVQIWKEMAEESEVGRAQEQDGGNPAALICHPRTPYRSPFLLPRSMRQSSGVSAVAFAPLAGTADSSLLSLPLRLLLVLFFLLLVLAHVVDPDDPPQQLGAVQIICPVKWIEFKEKNVFNHVKWIQSCRKHVSCRLAPSVF